MKKLLLLCSFVFLMSAIPAFAQESAYYSNRLNNLSSSLKRQTVDLSDRIYRDYRNSSSNYRSATEQLFLAQQMDAAAGIFQQMLRDNRSTSELRDAAAILTDLSRRFSGSNSWLWRDTQRTVSDIERELGGSGSSGGGGSSGSSSDGAIGMVVWRGTVDDVVQIDILNRTLGVRTISGNDHGNGLYTFTSALPQNRQVKVYVTKNKGRGDVKVIQQPSLNNNGGAVIEVRDKDGGAREYELEIYWKYE